MGEIIKKSDITLFLRSITKPFKQIDYQAVKLNRPFLKPETETGLEQSLNKKFSEMDKNGIFRYAQNIKSDIVFSFLTFYLYNQ